MSKLFQIFWFDCCQIDPDGAVSEVLIQRRRRIFLQVSIFPAKVIQTGFFIPDEMSSSELVLVDQLYRVTGLHKRIPLCVSDQNGS